MNIKTIILAEPKDTSMMYPFSIMHPVFELRVGALQIWERLKKEIPSVDLIFAGRKKQVEQFLNRYNLKNKTLEKGITVILSANILFTPEFFDELSAAIVNYPGKSLKITCHGKPIGGIFSPENWVENLTADDVKNYEGSFWENFSEIEFSKSIIVNNLWDAIYTNGKTISGDSQYFESYNKSSKIKYDGSYLIEPDNILIGKKVKIYPTAVLDASNGPIIVSSGVTIMPQSTVIGPCFIGENSTIKVGAKIYPNTSIGPRCKVGGEIEDSILQGYSNKQHDGFLGHSFISEWVNIGAGTDTSDLKNTYGKIKVEVAGKTHDTERQFLGFLCGDHTKTAIGSKINSGTISGICSMIMSNGFPNKSLKSFTWLTNNLVDIYEIDKAITTAKTVLSRRDKILSELEIELLKNEFENIKNA